MNRIFRPRLDMMSKNQDSSAYILQLHTFFARTLAPSRLLISLPNHSHNPPLRNIVMDIWTTATHSDVYLCRDTNVSVLPLTQTSPHTFGVGVFSVNSCFNVNFN